MGQLVEYSNRQKPSVGINTTLHCQISGMILLTAMFHPVEVKADYCWKKHHKRGKSNNIPTGQPVKRNISFW